MFKNPEELKYAKTHEWLKEEDGIYVVGLTDFAQDALGDVVFVNLPAVDDEVKAGESLGDIESVKAVSDVYSPVTGKVIEVNEAIVDDPVLVNSDPYAAWLIKVADVTEFEELLDASAYAEHCEQEG